MDQASDDRMTARLRALPERAQLAFAAACAARVLPVVRIVHGSLPEPLLEATRTIWSHVEGVDLTTQVATHVLHAAIDSLPPDDQSDEETEAARQAAASVYAAVESVYGEKPDRPAAAARHARDAVMRFSDFDDAAVAEERVWQEAALERLENLGDARLERGVFAPIAGDVPGWFRERAGEDLPLLRFAYGEDAANE